MQQNGNVPRVIGVVCERIANPSHLKMLDALTRQLNARGELTLLLQVSSRDDFRAQLHNAAPLPIVGLVFLTSLFEDELEIAHDILPQVPTLHLATRYAPSRANALNSDDYAAGEAISRLLLEQGHQRLGYLHAPRESAARSRQEMGYVDCLALANKTPVLLTATQDAREAGYQAMLNYLKTTYSSERIHALFCASDALAFGALQATRDFGQGAHVAVVGFGDVEEAASSTWHLTTWTQHPELIVAEGINRLLSQAGDNTGAWQQGALQIRHSHFGRAVAGEMLKCGCASRH
ncbi:LacI family transcriptional regulator [Enterobacterales bacterium CwR94]|nr:LacI family transcriptional regulator [Enterobacterales bacterium CwR94]